MTRAALPCLPTSQGVPPLSRIDEFPVSLVYARLVRLVSVSAIIAHASCLPAGSQILMTRMAWRGGEAALRILLS